MIDNWNSCIPIPGSNNHLKIQLESKISKLKQELYDLLASYCIADTTKYVSLVLIRNSIIEVMEQYDQPLLRAISASVLVAPVCDVKVMRVLYELSHPLFDIITVGVCRHDLIHQGHNLAVNLNNEIVKAYQETIQLTKHHYVDQQCQLANVLTCLVMQYA